MIPIVEVAKGIFRIGPLETGRVTPPTTPFLVVGSERSAIVEPGEDGQAPQLLEAIREIGVGFDRIAYLIASHIHLHHVHAVNVLLREMPQAKVVVHQRGAPHLVEPARLNESTLQVWGKESGCPQLSPVPEDRIWGVAGGEVIVLGGRELEIIETLGHAPHHICIFDRLTRTLFSGDAAGAFRGGPGNERGRPEIIPPLFDVEKAVESLHRLQALNASLQVVFGFFGGVGGVSHSPEKTLKWMEEDIRAVERICREAMKQKKSSREIGRLVHDYYQSVGIPYEDEAEMVRSEEAGGMRRAGEGPIGIYAYLLRQDPSLEMPQ